MYIFFFLLISPMLRETYTRGFNDENVYAIRKQNGNGDNRQKLNRAKYRSQQLYHRDSGCRDRSTRWITIAIVGASSCCSFWILLFLSVFVRKPKVLQRSLRPSHCFSRVARETDGDGERLCGFLTLNYLKNNNIFLSGVTITGVCAGFALNNYICTQITIIYELIQFIQIQIKGKIYII